MLIKWNFYMFSLVRNTSEYISYKVLILFAHLERKLKPAKWNVATWWKQRCLIKVIVLDMLGPVLILLGFQTLQSTAQQGIQLWVDLSFLLQHVEQQLVLGGTVNLCLLQPALHNLQLGILLSCLQTLTVTTQQTGYHWRCSNKLFLITCIS